MARPGLLRVSHAARQPARPSGLARSYVGNLRIDRDGNIVLAEANGPLTGGYEAGRGRARSSWSSRRRRADWGRVRVVAARTGTFYGIKMRAEDIYTIADARRRVPRAAGTFYGVPMLAGHVYVIGGGGEAFGDGGPAAQTFLNVDGLAATPAGAVLLAGFHNLRIRSIAPQRGERHGWIRAAVPKVASCGCYQ